MCFTNFCDFFNLELLEEVFKNKAECNPRILCFSSKNFRSQPVCFVCFCVFSKQNLGHNPCILRVSVIFLCTNIKVYFKSGQTPNVFYVFLCFSSGHREYHSCILCVFVFSFQIDLRPQRMCFTCFCVFYYDYLGEIFKATTRTDTQCVLCVFVFFLSLLGISFMYCFYEFLCFSSN